MRFLLVVFLLVSTTLLAQNSFIETNYDKDYFLFPIKPGEKNSISGCFGDIRVNHFHAGLDIRTDAREGLNVYAAADGYVSRIKIMRNGYGNAIYITHPNGLTTLYGHLKSFTNEINEYLRKRQYENQIWEIDLRLQPNEIEVSKAEVIAFSGNSGGSGGPHLHFEIRDKDENTLDPLDFKFKELEDIVSPKIDLISLVCLSEDARINGQFGVFDFKPILNKSGNYYLPNDIKLKGKIGIELLTYDKSHTNPFRTGIKEIKILEDQFQIYKFYLDKLSFENKLDMNIHINYERFIKEGLKLHKCYVDYGNNFKLYETNKYFGVIENKINQIHEYQIFVSDVFGNKSQLNFTTKTDTSSKISPIIKDSVKFGNPLISSKVIRDFLLITVKNSNINTHNIIVESVLNNNSRVLSYSTKSGKYFIYDLKNGIPTKIICENSVHIPEVNFQFLLNSNEYTYKNLEFDIKEALFHDNFIQINAISNSLELHKDLIPLKNPIKIKWNVKLTGLDTTKTKVFLIDKKPKFIGGTWSDSSIIFKAKEYGTYKLLSDKIGPSVQKRLLNSNQISFVVSDNLSGIRDIKCFLDKEWVLMEYEFKNGLVWASKLEKNKPFVGELELYVTDNCNNTTIYRSKITK